MLELIDSHAHLDEVEDIDNVLDKARQTGVTAIVAVGQDKSSNQANLQLAARYPGFVLPALGLHPWSLAGMETAQIEQSLEFILSNLSQAPAIGEIGLDYDKRVLKGAGKELQQEVLKRLLEIAARFNKPVSLHSRYAWKDCLRAVKDSGLTRAVFHWYTGFSSTLAEIVEAGYYISATPAAEYHEEHRRAVREAPLDRLLLETDSPVNYGRENRYRSQPSDVLRSLKACAEIKGMAEEEIARITTANARVLFKFDQS
ncbi:MAG: TatD family hydrolase [Dehalococcoidia bacterium]|nr:TatD family hydrolase [Dehalococcoidia bacterium]